MLRKLLFCLVLFVSVTGFAQTQGASSSKSAPFIIHKVKFGETLTKIAQKYGVTKTEILKINPSLLENSINPDQIIRIPNTNITTSKSTNNKSNNKPLADTLKTVTETKYHIVEKGQTLYSISKLYNVAISDILNWNNLSDNNLKLGSKLLIKVKTTKIDNKTAAVVTSEPKINIKPSASVVKKADSVLSQRPQNELFDELHEEKPDIQAVSNESQKQLIATYKSRLGTGKPVVQKGTGAPMTTSLGAMETVYFAMHKTLPIGTIVKIKNLVNSKIIYAKVIGKLPETDENKHVIVRYSLGVKKELQLQHGKCYVQLEYPE
jgi:LysM repeat protein